MVVAGVEVYPDDKDVELELAALELAGLELAPEELGLNSWDVLLVVVGSDVETVELDLTVVELRRVLEEDKLTEPRNRARTGPILRLTSNRAISRCLATISILTAAIPGCTYEAILRPTRVR